MTIQGAARIAHLHTRPQVVPGGGHHDHDDHHDYGDHDCDGCDGAYFPSRALLL